MKMINPPFYIQPHHLADMMAEDLSWARKRFTLIRKSLSKPSRAPVSITEYCAFECVDRQEVEDYLVNWMARNKAPVYKVTSYKTHLRKAS